jgi:histidine triad (HIT) family protein
LATIFTQIIQGGVPARFVWKDELCVAFLSINPIRSGHVLVVPREEVDHWLDLDDDMSAHLMNVSRSIGRAIQNGFQPTRVGFMIAGLDVPHLHLHLLPIDGIEDLNF